MSASDNDNNRLLSQFINGDEKAFSLLYENFVDRLYRYGTGFGFDTEVVMDCMQDVFLKLYNEHLFTENIRNISSYLFQSLKHKLIDYSRTHKNLRLDAIAESEFTINVSMSETADNLIKKEEQELLRKRIEELLDLLTPRQREAVYLRYMEEMPYEEIAKIMSLTVDSTRKLVFRSLDKLRQQVGWQTLSLFYLLLLFQLK